MGANQQQARQFAVSAGGGLQGDRIHAGDFGQTIAERLDDPESALRNLLRLIRVPVGNAVEAGNYFVHTRVVLHGAGPQRIHT